MVTCKDCLHNHVCDLWREQEGQDAKSWSDSDDWDCDYFADKSRFVELPCKVGDVVYRVSFSPKHIIPLTVEGFLYKGCSWQVRCTQLVPSWVGNQKEHNYIAFSSFGKAAFLAREEAEAKLAERTGE